MGLSPRDVLLFLQSSGRPCTMSDLTNPTPQEEEELGGLCIIMSILCSIIISIIITRKQPAGRRPGPGAGCFTPRPASPCQRHLRSGIHTDQNPSIFIIFIFGIYSLLILNVFLIMYRALTEANKFLAEVNTNLTEAGDAVHADMWMMTTSLCTWHLTLTI